MMRARRRERLFLLGALFALVAIGAGIVLAVDAPSDDPPPDATIDDTVPDDPEPEEPQPEPVVDQAGPLDGLESLQLSVSVSPDRDLVDGQVVDVGGAGFDPGATIAILQCWISEDGGSQEDCDLGDITIASADEDGVYTTSFTVRRLLDTTNGPRDCLSSTEAEGCRVSVGNPLDLDQSGAAPIFFLDVEASPIPTVEVTPTTGLLDGDLLEVSGLGFEPLTTLTVTQCPVGGNNDASRGCVSRNPGQTLEVDAQGAFALSVAAERHPQAFDGVHDCALDVYGCMLVVRTDSERSPNPVPLEFDAADAPVLPPEYTVTPSQGLAHGDLVRLEVFDMPADGSFGVRQCVDGGPRGLFCDVRGQIDVVDGDGAVDLIVVQLLVNGDDSIDCTQPERRCYLTLDGDLADEVRGPLRFDG